MTEETQSTVEEAVDKAPDAVTAFIVINFRPIIAWFGNENRCSNTVI